MQPTSEQCRCLEELSCKENSLKDNRSCFDQNRTLVDLHTVHLDRKMSEVAHIRN